MSEQKWYCGNAKLIPTNYGPITKVILDLQELYNASKAGHGFQTQAGKKMITIDVIQRREPDQYGNTHSVVINQWKPNQNGHNQSGSYQPSQSQGYDAQQNPKGFQNYQPPGQPSPSHPIGEYEDDIPF